MVDDKEDLLEICVDDVRSVVQTNTVDFAIVSQIYTRHCLIVLPVVVLQLDLSAEVQIKST